MRRVGNVNVGAAAYIVVVSVAQEVEGNNCIHQPDGADIVEDASTIAVAGVISVRGVVDDG